MEDNDPLSAALCDIVNKPKFKVILMLLRFELFFAHSSMLYLFLTIMK